MLYMAYIDNEFSRFLKISYNVLPGVDEYFN